MTFAPHAHPYFDAHRVHQRLWQGAGLSMPWALLPHYGFTHLVLCAEELQVPGMRVPGVHILRAPNDDSGKPITLKQAQDAAWAAEGVVKAIRGEGRVMVTCAMGRNRSGLVSALALRELLNVTYLEAGHVVQSRRPNAMRNPSFWKLLAKLDQRLLLKEKKSA